MKSSPVLAATLAFDDKGVPFSPAFNDVYHPHSGPFAQARQVFLQGNGLPARWQGRAQFTILETGFGLGNNFLATWAAWKDDAHRCERLLFVSLEKHPLSAGDMRRAHAHSSRPDLAEQLMAAWPPLTPNLHALDFEAGRVRLLLGLGDAAPLARDVVASVDAFFLDGFAPAHNEAMWSPDLFKALGRVAAPGATAATWSAARAVRDGLTQAGFAVQLAPGGGAKRDITLATFAPRAPMAIAPSRRCLGARPQRALIIGGGLAGAATAHALMQRSIACTVLDRHAEPAAEASGNPAGLFHGTLAMEDGTHARWHRAASFFAARVVREAVACGVAGAANGFLRLESELDVDAMQRLLDAQALPPSYVQALSADQASEQAGVALPSAAWFYPEGGWVDPRALVAHWLRGARWMGNTTIQSIEHRDQTWRALDEQGRCVADAPLLVLANAHDALRLTGLPTSALVSRRGQVSWCAPPTQADAINGLRLPVASGGYVLCMHDGTVVMGATNTTHDNDSAVREADHAFNVERAMRLLVRAPLPANAALQGRVSWRAVTRDRLPLIGPAPDLQAPAPRRHGVHLMARRPGLWLHAGLGSRGITTAALGGELIAAQVLGEPWPLEADLADALDPARVVNAKRNA